MILTKLQDIEKKIGQSIQNKSIIKLPMYGNLVEDIKESLELIRKGDDQKEEIIKELKDIYKRLKGVYEIIQSDCWDSFRHSLSNSESLSDKYNIKTAYENLSAVVEVLGLLYNDDLCKPIIDSDKNISLNDITSLQKKMKEALEKMQQQQSATNQGQGDDVNEYHDNANENEYCELEKKANAEFGKYIENGAIDSTSITKTQSGNLYAAITLQDNNNKNTSIKISEFLNSKFCTENNIAGFSINSSQKEVIKGYRDDKGVRYYDLGTTAQYGIKVDWYVGERECSITLSANSDGSIKIVGDKPADGDLEKNKDVRIKVNDEYLSLADAVKRCKQNNDLQEHEDSSKVSSKFDQSLVSQVMERISSRKA
ncbi:hypothetical protein NOX90_02760 [Wolbachia endosymbiont of Anurida maritima]|uniref:hypothetical protein n=1 Tax=Wolbachia endosymbiont of Anurida maritima TaxID=2850562 RepID=UPI0035CFEED4